MTLRHCILHTATVTLTGLTRTDYDSDDGGKVWMCGTDRHLHLDKKGHCVRTEFNECSVTMCSMKSCCARVRTEIDQKNVSWQLTINNI
jgi:hypothetical protein